MVAIFVLTCMIATVLFLFLRNYEAWIKFVIPIIFIIASCLAILFLLGKATERDGKNSGPEITQKDLDELDKRLREKKINKENEQDPDK